MLAVIFDYINGFHDTANAIATSVSTRALKPEDAIVLSATANFVGALAGTAVAKTIASGLVNPIPTTTTASTRTCVVAALIGAIIWNLITWRLGDPELVEPRPHRRVARGVDRRRRAGGRPVDGVVDKVIFPLVTSPLIGFAGAYAFMVGIYWVFRHARPQRLNGPLPAGPDPVGVVHGLQPRLERRPEDDGDHDPGAVLAGVIDTKEVPLPVILVAATAISLGTAVGGWRIIKTMGQKVVKLDPVHGFAAETTAATVILGARISGCRCRRRR